MKLMLNRVLCHMALFRCHLGLFNYPTHVSVQRKRMARTRRVCCHPAGAQDVFPDRLSRLPVGRLDVERSFVMHGMGGLGQGVVQGRQLVRRDLRHFPTQLLQAQRPAGNIRQDEVGRRHGRDEIAAGQAVVRAIEQIARRVGHSLAPVPLTVKV